MDWVILAVAGLFECFWATFMKLSEGFTRPGCTVLTVVGLIISMALLAYATKTLPLGTAYADARPDGHRRGRRRRRRDSAL